MEIVFTYFMDATFCIYILKFLYIYFRAIVSSGVGVDVGNKNGAVLLEN